MNVATPSSDVSERQRRITVSEYHRMIEAGILGEDEHVQLITGTMVAMKSKAALYARAGIPEYWIVNLAESTVEVHREPDPATGSYRARSVVPSGGTLTPTTVPAVRIDVADLFR